MLNELAKKIREQNKAKGFFLPARLIDESSNRSAIVALALIHTEVSEAIEAVREDHSQNLEHLEEEMADIIIRALDFAAGLGLDMDYAINKKLEYNKTRPYKHGKKL